MSEQRTLLDLSFHQEELPPYDAGHATPHAMVRRRVVIRSERGDALFEQTDYGHPGRFNGWEPRGIAPALQPKSEELAGICDRLASLLG